MELPDQFAWDSTNQWSQDWLRCGRTIVAGVSKTAIRGVLIANVNRHDENAVSHPHAYFRSRRAAMRSVERWACAHAERLRAEIATGARKKRAEAQPSREEKRLARTMRG